MPFSLGGNAVIPDASCERCEGITSYLDGYLARGVFYDYRLFTGTQSRTKPKDRPKTRTAIISKLGGGEEHLEYKTGEHPFSTTLPLLGVPGVLVGRPLGEPYPTTKAILFYHYPDGFIESLGLGPEGQAQVIHRGTVNFDTFARAIAKIGYCHAVAFDHIGAGVTLLPITEFIRGEIKYGPYLVGSDPRTTPPRRRLAYCTGSSSPGTIRITETS